MNWHLQLLRWSYCAFIAWVTVKTLVSGYAGHDVHMLVLASVELVAIAALLFEKSERPAAIVLIIVYAIAAVLTAAGGEMPIRFAYFAATAFFIAYARRIPAT
ncbi:hypothetical protein [Dyella sp. 2HG41-7]|uniref:hypothetical protein n=1 Tax=Dyella sp. 2HG41-7 TaxID=2883239 RepID=UPI001F2AB995|nr:hypothetical protein [Dyella sp. 2HG41-7]